MQVPHKLHLKTHWLFKTMFASGVIMMGYLLTGARRQVSLYDVAGLGLLVAFVIGFILASSKIDLDFETITATAPYGANRMRWSEVTWVEIDGMAYSFYGKEKKIELNLTFVQDGRSEFRALIEREAEVWRFGVYERMTTPPPAPE